MAFIIVAIVVVILGAGVVLLANARRQSTTGRLTRETRGRDTATSAAGTDLVDADARARADESKGLAGGALVRRAKGTPARYEPVDPDEIGITRRQFFNRGILGGMALGVGGFGAAALAFLWPSGAGGFGGVVNVGTVDDVEKTLATKIPYYNAGAKCYIQPYPKADLSKAKSIYKPPVYAGMQAGYVALYQKCPHLGCRVPWCATSQWFECPCHGSKYNRVGEKKGGPAPRGMDRFAVSVSGGAVLVNTGEVFDGPAIGTDTTGQGQEGAACV